VVTLILNIHDFQAAELGLIDNEAKCELICEDAEAVQKFRKLHLVYSDGH